MEDARRGRRQPITLPPPRLCYSFDFKLAEGTPVLAVRGGTIAAVVTHFSGGGAKAHLAPRANFVAVRHGPESASVPRRASGMSLDERRAELLLLSK